MKLNLPLLKEKYFHSSLLEHSGSGGQRRGGILNDLPFTSLRRSHTLILQPWRLRLSVPQPCVPRMTSSPPSCCCPRPVAYSVSQSSIRREGFIVCVRGGIFGGGCVEGKSKAMDGRMLRIPVHLCTTFPCSDYFPVLVAGVTTETNLQDKTMWDFMSSSCSSLP